MRVGEAARVQEGVAGWRKLPTITRLLPVRALRRERDGVSVCEWRLGVCGILGEAAWMVL